MELTIYPCLGKNIKYHKRVIGYVPEYTYYISELLTNGVIKDTYPFIRLIGESH